MEFVSCDLVIPPQPIPRARFCCYNTRMMYDPEHTRKFYNAYGELEWRRLEETPYGKLQGIIHEDILKSYVRPGDRVLDAGSGPGRFSIVAAQAGAKVTVLDISETQLELARQKVREAGCSEAIEQYLPADIVHLSALADAQFDVVLCYGGALSYVCEKRPKAAAELVRVLKPGGTLLVSVMSRLGVVMREVEIAEMERLENPHQPGPYGSVLWDVAETGDLPGFLSRRVGMMHSAMHLYTAAELAGLFPDCLVLEMAGSNVTIREFAPGNEKIAASPKAWTTVVELEKRFNREPGLVDTGSHIIMAAVKEP